MAPAEFEYQGFVRSTIAVAAACAKAGASGRETQVMLALSRYWDEDTDIIGVTPGGYVQCVSDVVETLGGFVSEKCVRKAIKGLERKGLIALDHVEKCGVAWLNVYRSRVFDVLDALPQSVQGALPQTVEGMVQNEISPTPNGGGCPPPNGVPALPQTGCQPSPNWGTTIEKNNREVQEKVPIEREKEKYQKKEIGDGWCVDGEPTPIECLSEPFVDEDVLTTPPDDYEPIDYGEPTVIEERARVVPRRAEVFDYARNSGDVAMMWAASDKAFINRWLARSRRVGFASDEEWHESLATECRRGYESRVKAS